MVEAEIYTRTRRKSGVPGKVDPAKYVFKELTAEIRKTLYFYYKKKIKRLCSLKVGFTLPNLGYLERRSLCLSWLPLKSMEGNGQF